MFVMFLGLVKFGRVVSLLWFRCLEEKYGIDYNVIVDENLSNEIKDNLVM